MRAFLFVIGLGLLLIVSSAALGDEAPTAEAEAVTSVKIERPPDSPEPTPEEKADAEIGQSAVEDIDKKFKLVAGSPDLSRIAGIVKTLRPATEKPYQEYEIKIIKSGAINAFALPGGYLYFSQGLLEAVESDDELAAVAGHEMAHVCLMHSRDLMSRDERYKKILGSVLLVSVLSNAEGVNSGAIATVGSLVAQDALNHYGRQAEYEADRGSILYLNRSGQYNPVAMLTVVEGLARLDAGYANSDLGVFQTHPEETDRAEAVIDLLRELGVPIERRRVTQSLSAEAGRTTLGDREIGELLLNGRVVYQPAVKLDGLSPVARAEESARILAELLLADLQLLEIEHVEDAGAIHFRARGETLLTISSGDAEAHENTVAELAARADDAIRIGFREERVERAY